MLNQNQRIPFWQSLMLYVPDMFLCFSMFKWWIHMVYVLVAIVISVYRCNIFINYSDVKMSAIASQITGVPIVYSTISSGAYQRKQLRVTDLCEGNPPTPVDSSHKGPVTRKMSPLDDVTMLISEVTLKELSKPQQYKRQQNEINVHNFCNVLRRKY